MSTEKKIATCDWFRKANFYQIYSRVHKCRDKNGDGQITAGEFSTFVDIRADLERIKDLNINAIWLMPIHPIGKINRKGQYGSPYAVRDYLGIDINFIERPRGRNYTDDELRRLGKQQLKDLIATTHEMGMRIILSFVGSHCAPDNLLLDPRNTTEKGGYHPEWFFMDETGIPTSPCPDWSDTADLKYGEGVDEMDKPKYENDADRQAMWNFMTSVLKYWVEEFDVDGFRCDFAHWMPLSFWKQAIESVKTIKPSTVFIGEVYERLRAHFDVGFDALYHFELYNELKSLYHEIRHEDPYFEIPYIQHRIEYENATYPAGYRMFRYTENHDEIRAAEMNGSPEAAKAPTLLCFTLPGTPFIYAGQESGETVRPPLFDGDRGVASFLEIDFSRDLRLTAWYRRIMQIRLGNTALTEGDIEFMESDNKRILAFSRVAADSRVIVAINFDYTDGTPQWANLRITRNLKSGDSAARRYKLHDALNDETYVYTGKQLREGLVVGLDQFKSHVFVVTEC